MTTPLHPTGASGPCPDANTALESGGELKFVLAGDSDLAVEAWARGRMAAEPGPDLRTTLYLDTTGLDVARRSKGFGRTRYRVRGGYRDGLSRLERKERRGDRYRRESVAVPPEEVAALGSSRVDPSWSGHSFHADVLRLGLRPACRVAFARTCYVSGDGAFPCRLTLDRAIVGAPATSWDPASCDGDPVPIVGVALLELGFPDGLPPLFRDLVSAQRLFPGRFSKYRRCLEAWGRLSPRTFHRA